MKHLKYICLAALAIGFTSCNDEEDFIENTNEEVNRPALTTGSADFSNYVSIGASFTAGFSDGALFKAAQEKSFPKLMSEKFALIGGGNFTQPLMNDNIGGLIAGGSPIIDPSTNANRFPPRLYLDLTGESPVPRRLNATSTTDIVSNNPTGTFNNIGIPGLKSFHLVAPGYSSPTANPYYTRFATASLPNVLSEALVQTPTFFSFSEIGGNDVLAYATSGGVGIDRTGDFNPAGYDFNDITDPTVFKTVIDNALNALTTGGTGAKGIVSNVPYVSSLPYFTTVPFNALDPTNPSLAPQIATLNAQLYGPLSQIFTAFGEPDRVKLLSATEANPILILDEDAVDRSAAIAAQLTPVLGAPTANAFGAIFGKARQATANDLIVLTASSAIATPVAGAPVPVNVNGVSYPMQDQWVLTPEEQLAIKTATDAYNGHIQDAVNMYNLALVDFKGILQRASTTGIASGEHILTTDLVTGGLISLDGVHLTTRGYAILANEMFKAIDTKYGTNFEASGSFFNAEDFNTNYSPTLQ